MSGLTVADASEQSLPMVPWTVQPNHGSHANSVSSQGSRPGAAKLHGWKEAQAGQAGENQTVMSMCYVHCRNEAATPETHEPAPLGKTLQFHST